MPNEPRSETPTYCNPIALPDYPRGLCSYHKETAFGFLRRYRHDYREMADPSVLYYNDKWYLYPSGGMAYVSEDFVTWRHHPINLRSASVLPPGSAGLGLPGTDGTIDIGYAPTILHHDNKFFIAGCSDRIAWSDNPLGPYQDLGQVTDTEGKPLKWGDPMLFADDDGRVYGYWGCGDPGIFVAEMDRRQINRMITPPKLLFAFDPAHEWERLGDFNEDPTMSMTEGAWMLKHGGRYYLTYSAPGTRWRSYAMGVYVADAPMGPFHYAARNPILRDVDGLVNGTGHGSLVRGPNDTLWAFYTCLVRNDHCWERRVGFDPAGFDEDGNLFVRGASEIPQWAPGFKANPHLGNDAGLLPLSVSKYPTASSEAPGREAGYAIDNYIRTWWEPATDDPLSWLEVDMRGSAKVKFISSAVRIMWKETGLDYNTGRAPGPVGYLLQGLASGGGWRTLVDQRDNATDMLIDYHTFAATPTDRVRLTITRRPPGINTGVLQLTMFGRAE